MITGKGENSLNVTGSYISKRKIPIQKLLGAKCLCCDVFAQHEARWVGYCGCLRSSELSLVCKLRLSVLGFHFPFFLVLVAVFFFLLYFSPKLLSLSRCIKKALQQSEVQLVLFYFLLSLLSFIILDFCKNTTPIQNDL